MVYVFAPSYQTVLFALHQFPLEEITFLTHNESIRNFAEKAGISVIFREYQTDLSMKGYKDFKNYCLQQVQDWENREVLFCFYTFDIWSLFQLNELREKNKVSFYNTDYLTAPGFDEITSRHVPTANNLLLHGMNPHYFKVWQRKRVFKLVTGLRTDVFQFEKNLFTLGLTIERCKSLFQPFAKKPGEEIFNRNRQKILEKINLPKPDILFIDGGEPGVQYPPELFAALNEVVKENNLQLAVKPHPLFRLPEGLKAYPQIDKFVPAELLFGMPRLVLSVASYGLVTFSAAHPAISLANLVKFESPEARERMLKIVKTGKIQLPGNLPELKDLMKKVVK